MTINLFAAFVLTIALFASASPAEACNCHKRSVDASEVVFEGTVTSLKIGAYTVPPPPGVSNEDWLASVRKGAGPKGEIEMTISFRELKGWRGQPVSTVVTPATGGACGYLFTAGKRYLVAGDLRPDGKVEVSICTATQPIERAKEILDHLKRTPPGR